MFYPVASLKRGGRFYLCWVADSWPLRFAAITHRQLWSQDIRQLCDDLMEVLTNESGRPACRFSLRLSSQLMRGLVRLYEKKVAVFLGDLCMLNAHVLKQANKKFVITEHVRRPMPHLELPRPELAPEPQDQEARVEEMIQNSNNVVSNIQDITLKEATIPEFQLPPNDGFGEENQDQVLQQLLGERTVEQILQQTDQLVPPTEQLADQTVEQMLHQDASLIQHSGMELDKTDKSDKSHVSADKSRLVQDAPQMERISEHDITMHRMSTAPQPMEIEFEKDIPEIPELPPPPKPAPETPAPPQIVVHSPEPEARQAQPAPVVAPAEALVDIELEELEQEQLSRRRRARPHLIVDKRTTLSSAFLRARIDNIHVDLRCEDSADDIVDLRVPFEILSKRPAHAGHRILSRGSAALNTMFQRRLATEARAYDREAEDSEPERVLRRRPARSLPKVSEEPEQPQEPQTEPPTLQLEVDRTREALNVSENIPELLQATADGAMNVTEVVPNLGPLSPRVSIQPEVPAPEQAVQPMDISEMLTQVLEEIPPPQPPAKRASQEKPDRPTKRSRPCNIISFRESLAVNNEKENIPPDETRPPPASQAKDVSQMLQEAGLAEGPPLGPTEQAAETQARPRVESDSSETPLGSLDRTKVSLGDSVRTTDTQRFIRLQWGIEGTMVKVLSMVRAGARPVTVHALLRRGPTLPTLGGIIAARCFTSLLKLKQHGFIVVTKDPETLAIRDVALGPRFEGVQ